MNAKEHKNSVVYYVMVFKETKMGLRMTVVYRHPFIASFLLRYIHPPSFHRNYFSACSTHYSFWGKAQQHSFRRVHFTHADNAEEDNDNDTKIVQLRVILTWQTRWAYV